MQEKEREERKKTKNIIKRKEIHKATSNFHHNKPLRLQSYLLIP